MSITDNIKFGPITLNWRLVAFYIGAPVFVATYETIGDRFWMEKLGVPSSILFHLGHALIPWFLAGGLTKLTMMLLKPWKPGLLVLTLIGAVLSNFVTAPYAAWLTSLFESRLDPNDINSVATSVTMGDFSALMLATSQAVFIWVIANFIFDRFLGLPRYRYDETDYAPLIIEPIIVEPPQSAGATLSERPTIAPKPHPRFLQRLERPLHPSDIIFLKAEEHYVQICSADQDEMVLYRFSDAVGEMNPELGFQVHRSYWVAIDAIEKITAADRRLTVHLKGGHAIPVSARYQEIVRQRAEAATIRIQQEDPE